MEYQHTPTPWQQKRLARLAKDNSCHCFGDNALISAGLVRTEGKTGLMGQNQVIVLITDAGRKFLAGGQ